ncbi:MULTISPECIES: S1 family peptidase [Halobacteriales]|uniref:Trypsin-like peptidase domain-containing protein n=2 Tax=Halobacteriales TaxID=2235 RepID=A0A1I0NJC7_9EURY|nr:serine protease [Natrinema salifodinae]SEW01271.1 Trypsin-like peptidase domain-containing protein [Natrinema salifodinae]
MPHSGKHPRDDVNPLFRKLTPIGYHYNGRNNQRFVGTGFFYFHQWGLDDYDDPSLPSTGPYLVTNKHVINPPDKSDPDSLIIHIRQSRAIRETTRKTVDLYDSDGSKKWREHPDNEWIDIAVLPLDFDIKSAHAFHRADIPNYGNAVSGGDVAKVIGYPNLLTDFHYLPIMRDALISSPYQVAYHDSPYFFIDSRLHNGMSGSPVIHIPDYYELNDVESDLKISDEEEELIDSLRVTGPAKRQSPTLLGIHSDEEFETESRLSLDDIRDKITDDNSEPGLEDYLEELDNRLMSVEQDSGLNRVWHANLLDDIIRNCDNEDVGTV